MYSQDTVPSVLNRRIPSIITEDLGAKRPKLSQSVGETTLASQIEAHRYTNIEQVKVDLKTALSAVVDELEGRVATKNAQPSQGHATDALTELTRVAALKTKFDHLILTETIQRPNALQFTTDEAGRGSENVSADNSLEQQPSGSCIEEPVRLPVLTLYGGGPQPKQLFSSLQQQLITEPRTLVKPDSLREEALPNGIFTSKVIPVHSISSSEERKNVPTLGELFPPPSKLQVLNPPRQSRVTSKGASVVNWVKVPESMPSSNTHRRTYPLQPLATSQWLSYGTTPSSIQQKPSEEKRKQHDRALSAGERQLPLRSGGIFASHRVAKSDALFCGAYSSFAPVSDSTGSIVPDHSKHSIWWKQSGERRHRELMHITSPKGVNGNLRGLDKAPHLIDFQEDDISGIVESWTSTELPRELVERKALKPPESISELDSLLEEISDLLETLHSYQRTRNLSPTNSALASANPDLSALTGSPASPSTVECDVYGMLQSQLAMIISTLPPYAISKLNGERLGLLKASTKIPIEGKNYVGTVEEDELPVKTRAMGTSSAVGVPPRSTNINPVIPARVNGYTHTPNTTPTPTVPRAASGAVPRAASTSTPQLPNQQYSSRPASSNHFFTGTAHSSYPPQRPAPMTAERLSHPKPPQYGQRPAQSPHTPLPNGYRAHPSQNGPSHSQQYTGTPHGIPSPATMDPVSKGQRPSQPGYQQKAMNAVGYPFGSRTAAREASPSKKTAPASSVPRLPPSTPGLPASQTRPAGYQAQAAQPGSSNAAAQSVNGSGGNGISTAGPAAQFLHLTRAEQEAVMNSQKVRLAQRDGRSGSGTSTPQPVGGTHPATPNRAAVSQPNGT